MSGDLSVTLPSSLASLAGLVVLHFAFRAHAVQQRALGFWRAGAFALAVVLFIALPVITWGRSLSAASGMPPHRTSPAEVLYLAVYLDFAFLWVVWSINSYCFPAREPYGNLWEEHWGSTYSPELKKRLLGPVLEHLDRDGKLGNVIVDVGSGAQPVSQFTPDRPERKFILVDIAAKNETSAATQYIRLDAGNITRPTLLSYRKALVRVCQFLGKDAHTRGSRGQATTLLFSDILNYVDFREVIRGFARFLQPGGRVIVVNLSTRGIPGQFSGSGLKRNEDLYEFLGEENFIIEDKRFPCRAEGATDESEEMIVLVARKGGQAAA